MPVTKKDKTD